MPTDLWCATHIFMTRVDEDVIVLDASLGQYRCLPELGPVLDPAPDGRLNPPPDDVAQALVEAGLASWSAGQARLVPVPCAREAQDAEASAFVTLLAAVSLTSSTLRFRRQSFADLLRPVRTAPPSSRPRLGEVLRAASDALPWIPGEGACLQRAWQLRRLLAAQGLSSTWMFGVRTWPFAAHCWLQIEDCVIADRLERVRLYSPIMAI